MTELLVNGRSIRVGELLGEGGEAVVYRISGSPDQCVKVYRDDATSDVMRLRAIKLKRAVSKGLPNGIYGPIDLVTNNRNQVKGFTMKVMPEGYLSVEELTDKVIWKSNQLSQRHIGWIFMALHQLINNLHAQDIIMGDGLSGKNIAFNPHSIHNAEDMWKSGMPLNDVIKQVEFVIGYDADAYQYGADAPCIIATADYVAPRQYNKDLESGQHPFLVEDDWWSFTINLAQSLLRIHPFRQGNTGVSNIVDRVHEGLHVLNPKLKYPNARVALPLLSLPDRLLAMLKHVFDEKRVEVFPYAELEVLDQQWKVSPHYDHEVVYAEERQACPHHQKDRSVPSLDSKKVAIGAVHIRKVAEGANYVRALFAKTIPNPNTKDSSVIAIISASRDNQLVLSLIDPTLDYSTQKRQHVTLPAQLSIRQTYDVNAEHVMVANNGIIDLFDIKTGKKTASNTSMQYSNQTVGALGVNPVYLTASTMVRNVKLYGHMFPEEIMQLSYAQSWFTASHDKTYSKDIIAGFSNLVGRYLWFIYADGMFYEIMSDTSSTKSEYMRNWRIHFDGHNIAFIRQMEDKMGNSRIRIDCFEIESRKIVSGLSKEIEEVEAVRIKSVSGQAAYANSTLLMPSDVGIISLSKNSDKASVMKGTENVSPQSLLCPVSVDGGTHLYLIDENDSSVYTVRS